MRILPDQNIGIFLLTWISLIAPGLSNHMPSKVQYEIIYLFPNFNDCTVAV